MAVAIRLKRLGKKKKPVYRVVVADQRNQRDGATIEEVGFYDPLQEPILIKVKEDRIKYWLSVGAKPTKPTERLLASVGILKARKVESANQKIAKKDRKSEDSED
ncbi:MAG: 30S ribosomal protein S16 [Rickettsiales bacterium]|nr:30S ribosomal protein S16 [Rickettsiales bacterium]|tara:strand:- start:7265 stop:7579 length:315 start_codon:yes stop_codon:yes gene_type:complete